MPQSNCLRIIAEEPEALEYSVPAPVPPELEGFISDDDYMEYMTDSGAMSELFPETVKSVGVHNVWADIDMGDMRFRRLDREIIERFSPRMESGSP